LKSPYFIRKISNFFYPDILRLTFTLPVTFGNLLKPSLFQKFLYCKVSFKFYIKLKFKFYISYCFVSLNFFCAF